MHIAEIMLEDNTKCDILTNYDDSYELLKLQFSQTPYI